MCYVINRWRWVVRIGSSRLQRQSLGVVLSLGFLLNEKYLRKNLLDWLLHLRMTNAIRRSTSSSRNRSSFCFESIFLSFIWGTGRFVAPLKYPLSIAHLLAKFKGNYLQSYAKQPTGDETFDHCPTARARQAVCSTDTMPEASLPSGETKIVSFHWPWALHWRMFYFLNMPLARLYVRVDSW